MTIISSEIMIIVRFYFTFLIISVFLMIQFLKRYGLTLLEDSAGSLQKTALYVFEFPTANHVTDLIKAIAEKYMNVRIHHI